MRRVITYDLEWKRGDKIEGDSDATRLILRLCGVFDGQRYRHYRTVEDFLDGELTHRNRGAWFYAHAGGLSDLIFFLKIFVEKGWKVRASFSGSSAIIVHVSKDEKNTFHFIDSYWLLRDKLSEIAKWIGMEKGDVDFAESSDAELIAYNELDCTILWNAIKSYEATIWSLGGQLMMTQASCAMNLFRRKYLSRDIPTCKSMNLRAKQGYVGSRVEVIQRKVSNAYYYDVNSSFPHAMTFDGPGMHYETTSRLRPFRKGQQYLAELTVSIPGQWLPPIPYRHKGRVYFPTGLWRGIFDSVDVELLAEYGFIHKVHEVSYFDAFSDMAAYAIDLFTRRAREGASKFENQTFKLLLNSLYGKFGENTMKRGMRINPDSTSCPHTPRHSLKENNPLEPECMEMLMPGIWLIDDEVDVPHAHTPLAAHITAIARKTLFDFMVDCNEVYYCDTDGFATDTEHRTSKMLGGLKLEKMIVDGYHVAPKVYRHDGMVKAKGFSLGDRNLLREDERTSKEAIEKGMERVKYERFTELIEGRDIEIQRMSRIMELSRRGDLTPVERTIRKGLRHMNRPKRRFLKDGTSVPWTIDELGKPFVKGVSDMEISE